MIFYKNSQAVEAATLWVNYIYGKRPVMLTTWSGNPNKYCYASITTTTGINPEDNCVLLDESSGIQYRLSYLGAEENKYSYVGYNI